MGTWMLKMGYCYDQYLKDATWRRAKGNDNKISCTKVVSVSTLCSKCSILTFSSCTMTCLPYGLQTISSCLFHIYSINTILYPYALPLIHISLLISSLCLSATWALRVKVITGNLLPRLPVILFFRNHLYNVFLVILYTTIFLATVLTTDLVFKTK